MAKSPPLHVPATLAHTAHPGEDQEGGPPGSPCGAQVARQGVVPDNVQHAGRGALVSVSLAPQGPEPLLAVCDPAVARTISHSRAPSTNALYENRWRLFVTWCNGRGLEPSVCPIPSILSFLQSLFDRGLAPSTIRVYAAAISAMHVKVDGLTVGSHALVKRFLRGTQRLRPLLQNQTPPWDLPLVLEALRKALFEPLGEAELKWVFVIQC